MPSIRRVDAYRPLGPAECPSSCPAKRAAPRPLRTFRPDGERNAVIVLDRKATPRIRTSVLTDERHRHLAHFAARQVIPTAERGVYFSVSL